MRAIKYLLLLLLFPFGIYAQESKGEKIPLPYTVTHKGLIKDKISTLHAPVIDVDSNRAEMRKKNPGLYEDNFGQIFIGGTISSIDKNKVTWTTDTIGDSLLFRIYIAEKGVNYCSINFDTLVLSANAMISFFASSGKNDFILVEQIDYAERQEDIDFWLKEAESDPSYSEMVYHKGQTVNSDHMLIELVVPLKERKLVKASINEIGMGRKKKLTKSSATEDTGLYPCHNDANCAPDSYIDGVSATVKLIGYTKPTSNTLSEKVHGTAVLLSPCDVFNIDSRGLLVTAYHLIAELDGDVSSISSDDIARLKWSQVIFNNQKIQCNGENGIGSPDIGITIEGVELLNHNKERDFALLKIKNTQNIPLNAKFTGYYRNNLVPSSIQKTDGFVVHHPFGEDKKISYMDANPEEDILDPANTPNHPYWQGWFYNLDVSKETGVLQGGSSGAPFFYNNGFFRGTYVGRTFVIAGEMSCDNIISNGFQFYSNNVSYYYEMLDQAVANKSPSSECSVDIVNPVTWDELQNPQNYLQVDACGVSSTQIEKGSSVTFNVSASNGTAPYTITINYGDGTNEVFANEYDGVVNGIVHQYNSSGNFLYSVDVVDALGNEKSGWICSSINVTEPYIPGQTSTADCSGFSVGISYDYDYNGGQSFYQDRIPEKTKIGFESWIIGGTGDSYIWELVNKTCGGVQSDCHFPDGFTLEKAVLKIDEPGEYTLRLTVYDVNPGVTGTCIAFDEKELTVYATTDRCIAGFINGELNPPRDYVETGYDYNFTFELKREQCFLSDYLDENALYGGLAKLYLEKWDNVFKWQEYNLASGYYTYSGNYKFGFKEMQKDLTHYGYINFVVPGIYRLTFKVRPYDEDIDPTSNTSPLPEPYNGFIRSSHQIINVEDCNEVTSNNVIVCQNNLATQFPGSNLDFRRDNIIVSGDPCSVLVPPGYFVDWRAKDHINLKPGFAVAKDAFFHASIFDCPIPTLKTAQDIGKDDNTEISSLSDKIGYVIGEDFLEVYPNPSSDRIQVNFIPAFQSDVRIELCNTDGRVLYTIQKQNAQSMYESLELNPYSSGLYLLKVTSKDAVFTRRIILNRQ